MKRGRDIMKEKIKKGINPNLYCYFIILIVAICLCIPLFQNGMFDSQDGEFHAARAVGTIEQLINGESPFVISRFSNELGFGWNLFYPPVSTAIITLYTFLANHIVLGMKLFIFTTFLLSGIFMYHFINAITRNTRTENTTKKINLAALLASILYITAPYHIANTYIRLAVGEMVSFIFIPLIFEGAYLLLQGKTEKSYLFILGAIGLILSHNISTMLICIVGLVFVLINVKKLKNTKILKTFLISTCIIVLSVIYFEVPLWEQETAADYEVFRYGKMYSPDFVQSHALNPLQLIYRDADGPDRPIYFCIGILLLIGLCITPFIWKRIKQENKKEYTFFLIIGLIATYMTTRFFPWKFLPDVLLMIQFPWRMLVIVTFCFSIVAGINFSLLFKTWQQKTRKKKNIVSYFATTILILSSTIYALSFVTNLNMRAIDNSYYKEQEIIDTTNKVSRYSSFLEYWPQKAIDSIDYIVKHDHKVHILEGQATISNEIKTNGKLEFEISGVGEDSIIELPYLYYKGYTIEYTASNSNETVVLEAIESEHGMVAFYADSNMNGKIKVAYHATILHKICFAISGITILCYCSYLVIKRTKRKKKLEIHVNKNT